MSIWCQSLDPFPIGVLENLKLAPASSEKKEKREREKKWSSVTFAHFHPAYTSTTRNFKKTTGCHCMCLRRRRSQWATVNQHATTFTAVFFAFYSYLYSTSSSTLYYAWYQISAQKFMWKRWINPFMLINSNTFNIHTSW